MCFKQQSRQGQGMLHTLTNFRRPTDVPIPIFEPDEIQFKGRRLA
jgi:hypothetical protein